MEFEGNKKKEDKFNKWRWDPLNGIIH